MTCLSFAATSVQAWTRNQGLELRVQYLLGVFLVTEE